MSLLANLGSRPAHLEARNLELKKEADEPVDEIPAPESEERPE